MPEIEWFVIIRGRQRGPYRAFQLEALEGITPDTLAWREGMKEWKPIRDIPELSFLFEEPAPKEPPVEEKLPGEKEVADGLVLTFPYIEPPWLFWLIFLILVCAYGLFRLLSNP
jgi:hypothetical protein